ncbi:HEXXH motif domain-containing protein [Planomonospora sp. ID91781]|uniref:HEXXH motif domain-containing protein n=1 Tax=Planomonospora sphaerica TaxID=161355 RepID=A0A171DNJ5_9ACTN|nr:MULTISPECIES: HEXXH motif domain-containing protein [Planomonospora]MBG0822807.1 HEXXH motif domain-containing protein [Planomonospora sp. ID91781]GAT70630.1 HEXXH motif domain-containing protein [Planomonospora sphaerica]
MRLFTQPLSGTVLAELAAGGGGAAAVRELAAAQRLKNLLLLRGVVEEAAAARHPHAELAAEAYGLLSDMENRAADRVGRVLRHPAAGAWAWRTYRSLSRRTGEEDPGRLGALALSAAIGSQTACELRLPVAGRDVMLPSLGLLTLPAGLGAVADVVVRPDGTGTGGGTGDGDGAELRFGRFTVRVDPHRDGPGWQALHRLAVRPGLSLIVDDLDPYRWAVADVVEPRLTAERRRWWQSCLRDAWRILTAHHGIVAEEVAAATSVLTPIQAPASGQNSATSRETFGTMALSEPRHGLGFAETFAHEVQHAKLTALTDMVDLTLPDDGQRHYAPWRPDPRPVYGLLQGAYAYLGVAGFWHRQRAFESGDAGFRAQVEFARWREGAHLVTGTLQASGCLTEQGQEFVAVMRGTLERLLAQPVDPAAAAQARREADRHREEWTRRNT